jgi:glutamine amidotransferase
VLSEPLVDLPDAWAEIPEETVVIAKGGSVEHHRFVPRLPMIDSSTNQASYGQAAG